MNRSRVVILFMSQWISACFSQQARPTFTLGMTVDEVRQRFGMPTRYYDVAEEHYLNTDAEAQIARKVSGDQMVDDIYDIKTSFNTYHFHTKYFYDQRQPPFGPTKKLVEVEFMMDKPVADVKPLLADFPEAVELCSPQCTIFNEDSVLGKQLFVQPTNPSQEQIKAAGLLAAGSIDKLPTETYVRGFKFKFNTFGEKQLQSGSYGLMIKGKSTGGTLTRSGVWPGK
jgi:hypothetical protein